MKEYEILWEKRDELWMKACAWEDIDELTALVGEAEFSEDNPWAKLWLRAERDLQELNIRLMERSNRYK